MSTSEAKPNSWDQRGIYLRLSKQRKGLLLKIAKDMGEESTPHRALSAYLEAYRDRDHLACHDDVLGAADLNDLRSDIGQRFDGLEQTVDLMEARLADLLTQLGNALTPLSSLAAAGDALPLCERLAEWLERVQRERNLPIARLALVRATWRATTAGEGAGAPVTLEFNTELLNIDGQPLKALVPGHVRIEALAPAMTLAAHVHAAPTAVIVLTCQPAIAGRWNITAFRVDTHGALGEQFASFSL